MTAPSSRPPYRTGQPHLDEQVDRLVEALAIDARRASHLRELVTAALKLGLDDAATADVKLVATAVKEMRHAFRVFRPYRHVRKVTVFGSARTAPGDPAWEQAHDFAARMADRGWMVITGAGPGIMAAAQGGAGRERSFGVRIRLPFEQGANEVISGADTLVNFKYFFTRKLTFLKETDAIVLHPGGFGTHDEGFETLTLVQTGKADPMPIVFIEPPGSSYWEEWHEYVERHLLRPGLISANDTKLYVVTEDVERAVDELVRFYRVYHSQRMVRDRLVLRLLADVPQDTVAELSREFAPLVAAGGIEKSGPLPEEDDEPELAHLPRLVFEFARAECATLRLLIDRLNTLELPLLPDPGASGASGAPERSARGGVPGQS